MFLMSAKPARSVFITGAGIGIGAACARSFAAAGYRVVLADVLKEEGAGTAAQIRSDGGQAEFVSLDVRDSEQVDDAVRRTQGDGFDVVIANAGIARRQPFCDLDDAGWMETVDVNLGGSMRVLRATLPAMVERRSGALIALSSISGIAYGWDQHAHYSASKAGVIGLVRALAVEFGAAGIRVNGIAPGFIRTAQSLSVEHSLGEEGLRKAVATVPLGRIGEPDDVADVALFLASDAARYVSGQVLVVDGGLLVRQA
jgi:3-oxoacyl-[acyl-carrier protein] reductase